jgi:hypothetical protein
MNNCTITHRYQTAGQNRNTKIANESFQKLENLEYCHVLVTREGVGIDNLIYRMLISRNYK